jgi:leucyl aminopeptidase
MTVQINYKNFVSKKVSSNLILFVDEKFNISGLKKHISNSEFSYIADLLKTSDLKKDLHAFEINSKKTIFLVSIKKDIKTSDIENLGAKFHGYIDYDKKRDYLINPDNINIKLKNVVGHFLHGLKLKSYEFNIYKSKKNTKSVTINVIGNKNKISQQDQLRFKAIEEGTFFARDLVSEPGNILHPDEYAKRINTLKKFGLKINIYDEKKLKKLGMNALLGVGQGSIRGSYLVTMEWNGAKNNSKPLAFVGKGVCFDTGGISLNLLSLWKT